MNKPIRLQTKEKLDVIPMKDESKEKSQQTEKPTQAAKPVKPGKSEKGESEKIQSAQLKKIEAEIQLRKAKADYEIEQINFKKNLAVKELRNIGEQIKAKQDQLSSFQKKIEELQS